MSLDNEFFRIVETLESENPGKTIILNAKTFEVIVISDVIVEIVEKARIARENGTVTVFIGGRNKPPEMMGIPGFGCSSENKNA